MGDENILIVDGDMQILCQDNFIKLSSVANHSLEFTQNPRDDLVD